MGHRNLWAICFSILFSLLINSNVYAYVSDWICTFDKTTVENNYSDGVNIQITLLNENGNINTTRDGAPSYYKIVVECEQGYINTDNVDGNYIPTSENLYWGDGREKDPGSYYYQGFTPNIESHTAYVEPISGIAGTFVYFKSFTGLAEINVSLIHYVLGTQGGMEVSIKKTTTYSITVTEEKENDVSFLPRLSTIEASPILTVIHPGGENIICVKTKDQNGNLIAPTGENAIYVTYDLEIGNLYNCDRNEDLIGSSGSAGMFYNSGDQVYASSAKIAKSINYLSYQSYYRGAQVKITFENADKSVLKTIVFDLGTDPVGFTDKQYIPYLKTDSETQSWIFITNLGDTTYNVNITGYYSDGSEIGPDAIIDTLSRYERKAYPVYSEPRNLWGRYLESSEYSVRVSYDENSSLRVLGVMVSSATETEDDFVIINGVAPRGQSLYIPETINESPYSTFLAVCNTEYTSQTVTVDSYDDSGAANGTQASESIPSYGFVAKDIADWNEGYTGSGWTKIFSSQNDIVGAVIYTNTTNGRNTQGGLSLNTHESRSGSYQGIMPIAVNVENYVTPYLMIANSSSSNISVDVIAYMPNGSAFVSSYRINVPSNGHVTQLLDDESFGEPLPENFSLKLTSTSLDVYCLMAYQFDSSVGGDFILAEALEGNTWESNHVPHVVTNDLYSTFMFFRNTGTAANTITINMYNNDGTEVIGLLNGYDVTIPVNGLTMVVLEDLGDGSMVASGIDSFVSTFVYRNNARDSYGGLSIND